MNRTFRPDLSLAAAPDCVRILLSGSRLHSVRRCLSPDPDSPIEAIDFAILDYINPRTIEHPSIAVFFNLFRSLSSFLLVSERRFWNGRAENTEGTRYRPLRQNLAVLPSPVNGLACRTSRSCENFERTHAQCRDRILSMPKFIGGTFPRRNRLDRLHSASLSILFTYFPLFTGDATMTPASSPSIFRSVHHHQPQYPLHLRYLSRTILSRSRFSTVLTLLDLHSDGSRTERPEKEKNNDGWNHVDLPRV